MTRLRYGVDIRATFGWEGLFGGKLRVSISAPEVPVVLVGTRAAELATSGSGSPSDIWRSIYETVLRPSCAAHARSHATRPVTHCLLCSSADLADSRRSFVKSRHASAAGFVDLSHQHSPHDKVATNFTLLDGLL